MRLARAMAFAWLVLLATGQSAFAHESRPAYLEITEQPAGTVAIVWKQPLQGEYGLHLVPHLSSGWLDREPGDRYATSAYLISTWQVTIPVDQSLRGQTVSVEGLSGTLTDALVRVRLADGLKQDALLRGEAPAVEIGSETSETSGPWRFVMLGIAHILSGPDHLLFILGLMLIVASNRKLVLTITGFTAGHTITLIAASLLKLDLPIALIDLLIAFSIAFLGAEILRAQAGGRSLTTERPWLVAMLFGLLHGLGFATGLAGVGLQGLELVTALFEFNVGVELGQLGFVIAALIVLLALSSVRAAWPAIARRGPAYAVGVAGAVWALERAAQIVGV